MSRSHSSIQEIADRSGYSPATVSRVINERPGVSERARKVIGSVITELRYVPNQWARSLVTSRTHTVAFLLADIANPFYPELAKAAEQAASSKGYRVILCNTGTESEKVGEHIEALKKWRVDGFIFASSQVRDPQVEEVVEAGYPHVCVNRRPNGVACNFVVSDNERGGYLAVKHLLELGHERIGHISAPAQITNVEERRSGYLRAVQEAGLEADPQLIVEGDFSEQSGLTQTCRLLELPQPPTAIFTENDLMAFGALGAAAELGLRVPSDLSVVGYDDIAFASSPLIQLTTVAQSTSEMGRMATELLVEQIESDTPIEPRQIFIDPLLRIRRSTGAVTTRLGTPP